MNQYKKHRRLYRRATAKACGAAAGIFIMGMAAGAGAHAYFTPTVHTAERTVPVAEHVPAAQHVPAAENVPYITPLEEDENAQIAAALMEKATDLGEFRATAYCNCEICCEEWAEYHQTYTGATPMEGVTVAVDPDVISLGSMVYVTFADGTVGEYVAQDIGGAIKGNRIDIYFENHEDALAFGVQKVDVSYLEEV